MRSIQMVIPLAFVSQTNVEGRPLKGGEVVEELIDELFDRKDMPPLEYRAFENSTLGRPCRFTIRAPRSGFFPGVRTFPRAPTHGLLDQTINVHRATGETDAAIERGGGAALAVLQTSDVIRFHVDGHIITRKLINPETIADVRSSIDAVYSEREVEAYRQRVRVCCGDDAVAELDHLPESIRQDPENIITLADIKLLEAAREGQTISFLQLFNLWRSSEAVFRFISSEAVAGTAAKLLGVSGNKRLRLYQDALFVKREDDGETHWHSDLGMIPLDTNDFVTCWIPLQPIPTEDQGGSGLIFATGSHRDMARLMWHANDEEEEERDYAEVSAGAMELGDVTWHHGWLLHAAAPNQMGTVRLALAASFFVDGTVRLRSKEGPEDEDAESYAEWEKDVSPGEAARHKLLPIVWPPMPVEKCLQQRAVKYDSIIFEQINKRNHNVNCKTRITCRK